jgi:hypothetical protein
MTISISGALANQATTDQTPISPFSGVSITDTDAGQIETVTVSLSAAADGALSNLGGGSYDPTTGVYTITGVDDVVNAALDGLVFTPTPGQVAPGQTVTTGFTIVATDAAGATATNRTTTVVAAPQVAPTITGVPATYEVGEPFPYGAITVSDGNFGQIDTVTVSLSSLANNVGLVPGTGAGSYDSTTGVYTVSGTDVQVQLALRYLEFSAGSGNSPTRSPSQTPIRMGAARRS